MSSLREEGEGVVSRLVWKLRPTETLKLQSVRIVEGKFVSFASGQKQRILALMRVRLAEAFEEAKLDYAAAMRVSLQQQRMKGLFDGLYRAAVPFLYISMMVPSSEEEEKEVFEFDLVVATWVDAKAKEVAQALQDLEQRASVLAATLTVALPSAQVRRLSRNELRGFVKTLFLPTEPNLPQTGSASVVSTLETFDDRSPMSGSVVQSPQFYVPNAAESGRGGVLLGRVRSSGGDFHDFHLQLDDLKRHVVVLGMSVDSQEPIIYRRQGTVGIGKIGRLVDSYFTDDGEGKAFPADLECVAFDSDTGKVNWSPVRYVLRHHYAGRMLRIGLETGRSITVTPNHSLFAAVNGKARQVDASTLQAGDYLVGPRSVPQPASNKAINLVDLLKSEEGIFLYNVPPAVFDRAGIPRQATLRSDRRLPLKFASLLSPEETVSVAVGYRSSRTKLTTVLDVDEDFAKLLGFYTAKGSASISQKSYKVSFTFGPGDQDAISECQRILLTKFGVSVSPQAHGAESVRLQFSHRILATLFASLVGRGARNKHLPVAILNSPAPIRRMFIRAWIVGDSGVTVSRDLVNEVAYALLFDECVATVSHWRARSGTVIEGRRVKSLPAYHLRTSVEDACQPTTNKAGYPVAQVPNPLSLVYSKKLNRRYLTRDVLDNIRVRLNRLESYSSKRKDVSHDGFYRAYSSRFLKSRGGRVIAKQELKMAREELEGLEVLVKSDLSFLRVTSVERVDATSDFVYDLSVPKKENFLAGFGGVFCHNTGSGKSTTAGTVVRQVAEMGLPVMVLDWHIYGRFWC